MIARYLRLIAPALLLASCSQQAEQSDAEPRQDVASPAPAIWEFSAKDGALEGWMFGTIHALPADIEWRTPLLSKLVDRSEVLVVEVAGLDDQDSLSRIYARLASTPGLAPLDRRIASGYRRDLRELMAKGGFDGADFRSTETWAAALTLAQIDRVGDPANGVDRALLAEFPRQAVVELEGAEKQLGIFDTLPESEQLDLLESIVVEASAEEAADPMEPVELWLAGDIEALMKEDRGSLLADPELKEALLDQRNRDWLPHIVELADSNGPMLIAVGTAHLGGETGLPTLLEAEGYTVRRIQ